MADQATWDDPIAAGYNHQCKFHEDAEPEVLTVGSDKYVICSICKSGWKFVPKPAAE